DGGAEGQGDWQPGPLHPGAHPALLPRALRRRRPAGRAGLVCALPVPAALSGDGRRQRRPRHGCVGVRAGSERVSPHIEIAGRKIGPEHEPFVICELSGNHNGSLERALAMVDAAAATGADARTLHDLYAEAFTPYEWHGALFESARRRGVILFSTPFDESAVDLLESLGAP